MSVSSSSPSLAMQEGQKQSIALNTEDCLRGASMVDDADLVQGAKLLKMAKQLTKSEAIAHDATLRSLAATLAITAVTPIVQAIAAAHSAPAAAHSAPAAAHSAPVAATTAPSSTLSGLSTEEKDVLHVHVLSMNGERTETIQFHEDAPTPEHRKLTEAIVTEQWKCITVAKSLNVQVNFASPFLPILVQSPTSCSTMEAIMTTLPEEVLYSLRVRLLTQPVLRSLSLEECLEIARPVVPPFIRLVRSNDYEEAPVAQRLFHCCKDGLVNISEMNFVVKALERARNRESRGVLVFVRQEPPQSSTGRFLLFEVMPKATACLAAMSDDARTLFLPSLPPAVLLYHHPGGDLATFLYSIPLNLRQCTKQRKRKTKSQKRAIAKARLQQQQQQEEQSLLAKERQLFEQKYAKQSWQQSLNEQLPIMHSAVLNNPHRFCRVRGRWGTTMHYLVNSLWLREWYHPLNRWTSYEEKNLDALFSRTTTTAITPTIPHESWVKTPVRIGQAKDELVAVDGPATRLFDELDNTSCVKCLPQEDLKIITAFAAPTFTWIQHRSSSSQPDIKQLEMPQERKDRHMSRAVKHASSTTDVPRDAPRPVQKPVGRPTAPISGATAPISGPTVKTSEVKDGSMWGQSSHIDVAQSLSATMAAASSHSRWFFDAATSLSKSSGRMIHINEPRTSDQTVRKTPLDDAIRGKPNSSSEVVRRFYELVAVLWQIFDPDIAPVFTINDYLAPGHDKPVREFVCWSQLKPLLIIGPTGAPTLNVIDGPDSESHEDGWMMDRAEPYGQCNEGEVLFTTLPLNVLGALRFHMWCTRGQLTREAALEICERYFPVHVKCNFDSGWSKLNRLARVYGASTSRMDPCELMNVAAAVQTAWRAHKSFLLVFIFNPPVHTLLQRYMLFETSMCEPFNPFPTLTNSAYYGRQCPPLVFTNHIPTAQCTVQHQSEFFAADSALVIREPLEIPFMRHNIGDVKSTPAPASASDETEVKTDTTVKPDTTVGALLEQLKRQGAEADKRCASANSPWARAVAHAQRRRWIHTQAQILAQVAASQDEHTVQKR